MVKKDDKDYKNIKHSKADKIKEATVTSYKSGNSLVVTIPADFPFKKGDSFKIKYNPGNDEIVMKKTFTEKEIEEELEKISNFAGNFDLPEIESMTAEELDDYIEGIYD